MIVDLKNLKCQNCPALRLRDRQLTKITRWETLREVVVSSIKQINLYLLGESIPENRFFYDKTSLYHSDGLRFFCRKELVDDGSEDELFEYLRQRGILLVDCAVCPLYLLKEEGDKILAASYCLKRNTLPYLNLNPVAPIITIFPPRRGFTPKSIPEIQKRIIKAFRFPKQSTHLSGLKKEIEDYLQRGNCN